MAPAPELTESLTLWQRTDWRGEPAWTSVSDQVRAIVSEARARLIYLGAVDGAVNLLNAPWPRMTPSAERPWPNLGGHRFWLGPQHRWTWPPPAEWEYSAARATSTREGTLSLEHFHLNSDYPALTREYSWQGNRMRCAVRWTDDGRRFFGLHVVAVDAPIELTTRLQEAPCAPAGLVAARMIDPEPPLRLPHPALQLAGGTARVLSGAKRVKFGFVPQALAVARSAGWTVTVHPGPCSEADGDAPDFGYLSQVWVGEAGCELAELEQLTPPLRGDSFGRCSSTIFIEATPPHP